MRVKQVRAVLDDPAQRRFGPGQLLFGSDLFLRIQHHGQSRRATAVLHRVGDDPDIQNGPVLRQVTGRIRRRPLGPAILGELCPEPRPVFSRADLVE
jgi:hypothetical protein